MRGVIAFLVWLFSFWTWIKGFFVRWCRAPPLDQSSSETRGVKDLGSAEGQHESALADFLSSFPDGRGVSGYSFDEDKFTLSGYDNDEVRREFVGSAADSREFLAAVASMTVVWGRNVSIDGWGVDQYKHIEEVVEALLSNKDLQDVTFYIDYSAPRMVECFSKLLLGNNVIRSLNLSTYSKKLGKDAAEQLASALQQNRVLRRLKMWGMEVDDEGMEVLMKPLKGPDSVLEQLTLFPIMTDVGLEHVGVMLATNTSLKQLHIKAAGGRDTVSMRGFTSIRDALCSNQTLESLICTVSSSMELKALLEPLMPTNNNPQPNNTLTSLGFLAESRIRGKEGMAILLDMLRTNTSLLYLTLCGIEELSKNDPDAIENTVAILEALKSNKSLKRIKFINCDGVEGPKILGTIMDLLLENHCLEHIDLDGTGLGRSGDAEYVNSALLKRKKLKLWDLVQSMGTVRPTSGRVFLCGHPYAGKTTLRKSIKQLPGFQNKRRHRYRKIFQSDKGPKSSRADIVENERTRGIEVDNVVCNGIGISIWDMAGQTEYHSFHDLVVPSLSADGSCSLFLVMCNPMERTSQRTRKTSDIKSEIEYWLRFIASNTRRSWSYRPHVSIVMTHRDIWPKNDNKFATRLTDVVKELKSQFEGFLEFDAGRDIFMVGGGDSSHADEIFEFIKSFLKELLGRLPKTIKACVEVQRLLAEWNVTLSKRPRNVHTSKQPVLQWKEFCDNICKEVEELYDVDEELARRKKEFVAISLNDGGHIMYHEEGGFVITNPHWFCHDIMGEFLYSCTSLDPNLEMVSIHGNISIQHVHQILLGIVGGEGHENLSDDILSMMKKLHICYEQDVNTIMMPSTLRDKKNLKWSMKHESSNLTFVGRRMVCKDKEQTMLSLGFFPRLQVFFFKKFQNNNVGYSYELFQDVIKFLCDGIEVIIEFNDGDIDILLRSDQSHDKLLEFLEISVVLHINDLLSDPTLGCPGIILEEHIFRPECVWELFDSKDRKDQFVSMEDLELELLTNGLNATHIWKKCQSGRLGIGYDTVKKLLGSKAWKKILLKRGEDLQKDEKRILGTCGQSDPVMCQEGVVYSWTSSIWKITPRFFNLLSGWPNAQITEVKVQLQNIDKKLDEHHVQVISRLDDILQMEEKLMKMQETLFHEVCSRIDDVMAFSIRMQQSQVPRLAYLSQTSKKQLLTYFVPGYMTFELHLMYESRDGIHEIADQEGCLVNFGTKETRTFVTMMVWGLKIATILTKIGAHVVGGMGEMVPDFGEVVQLTGLILDTPGLLNQQIPPTFLEPLPNDVKRRPSISHGDISGTEEWLIKFLEPKCKEKSKFYEMFKLKKVAYKATDGGHSIAWVCGSCERNGVQSGIILQ